MMRTLLTALAVGGAAAAMPGDAAAQTGRNLRREVDTTFFFSKIGTVLVGNGAATIIVTGWDQSTIRVKARNEDGALRFEATSSRVVIEATRQHDDAIIQVTVPRGVRVVARTNSGDITIKETRGDVEAETSSGDILVVGARDVEATNLSGDLDVRQSSGSTTISSNNGDCSVADSKGSIDASSVSGDVRVTKSWAKMVRAETTNGTVSFDGEILAEGRYELLSHSGDIWLALPKTASAQIGVATWSGSVESEFPITLRPGFATTPTETGTKRFTFTLGQGSARVTAETFSGNVSITSTGGK
ncbi:MAG TPA: DUF4097 family beta strand repeat-containing protein [Gemmatimonadaceae bacterium]|nr:DUF4097 family beta strand repeat-containing protein [Gemmatimonadaceae bacterium]